MLHFAAYRPGVAAPDASLCVPSRWAAPEAWSLDLQRHRYILGMWAGQGAGESAKFWLAVLTDLRNRGVRDVFFVVCDGLKGPPDSVNAVWPDAIARRPSFRRASCVGRWVG